VIFVRWTPHRQWTHLSAPLLSHFLLSPPLPFPTVLLPSPMPAAAPSTVISRAAHWSCPHFVITARNSIPEHFEPGPGPARPRTLLDGRGQRSWSPRKNFLARVRPEMLFLVVLLYKMRGRPAQARSRPENWGPTRPVGWSWAGFFSARNNRNFF
jgi:hypothetical protein